MYEQNEHLLREKSKTPAIAGCQTHGPTPLCGRGIFAVSVLQSAVLHG